MLRPPASLEDLAVIRDEIPAPNTQLDEFAWNAELTDFGSARFEADNDFAGCISISHLLFQPLCTQLDLEPGLKAAGGIFDLYRLPRASANKLKINIVVITIT